jgi:hypothetical protein
MSNAQTFALALANAPTLALRAPRANSPIIDLLRKEQSDWEAAVTAALANATIGWLQESSSAPTPDGEREEARERGRARRTLSALKRAWASSRSLPILPLSEGGWVLEAVVREARAIEPSMAWGRGSAHYASQYEW